MNWKTSAQKLWEPVNAIGIDLFRKLLAIFLLLEVGEFYSYDVLKKTFLLPKTNIPFDFCTWLPVLPGKAIYLPLFLMLVGAVLLFSNKYSRQGALIYLLSFGYLFLLDISYYNNHFYLMLLLCLFFTFYNPVKIKNVNYVPKILLYLFQFQVVVVYFYGGITKLNPDWLFHQEPMREMLTLTNHHQWSDSVVYFYSYGGLLFDLTIGFFLLNPSTRKQAIIVNIVFHIFNHFMFSTRDNASIGLFPFLMICTNLLFLDPEKLQSWMVKNLPFYFKEKTVKKQQNGSPAVFNVQNKQLITILVSVYVLIQLLVPLRHFLLPGNVDWTGEGYYFSWRMKIRSKHANSTIYVQSDAKAPRVKVEPLNVLNTLQYKSVCEDPAAMYFFIQYLKKTGKQEMGMQDPRFYLNWTCAMNGHPSKSVVDSTIDFASLTHSRISSDKWILPFN